MLRNARVPVLILFSGILTYCSSPESEEKDQKNVPSASAVVERIDLGPADFSTRDATWQGSYRLNENDASFTEKEFSSYSLQLTYRADKGKYHAYFGDFVAKPYGEGFTSDPEWLTCEAKMVDGVLKLYFVEYHMHRGTSGYKPGELIAAFKKNDRFTLIPIWDGVVQPRAGKEAGLVFNFTDGSALDFHKEEIPDGPFTLEPLEDLSLVSYLEGSQKGWVEAVLEGDYYIVASDDPNRDLQSIEVYKEDDGERYILKINSEEYFIGSATRKKEDAPYDVQLYTKDDLSSGNRMGTFLWVQQLDDQVIEIDFFDQWNARVVETVAYIPFCAAMNCPEEKTVKARLKGISIVEGMVGFSFETESGQELYFGRHEFDMSQYAGVLWEHQEGESIFGHYEILTDELLTLTYVKKEVENEMEPTETYETEVLLKMER